MVNDGYAKRARHEGYAARSAYKLIQINDKHKVIARGDRVLDLGSSPGSWLQVARELAGDRAPLAGVDLKPVRAAVDAKTAEGDAFEMTPEDLLALGGVEAYDVLLSDMAPNTSGDPRSDHFLSVRLADQVLDLALKLLRPGGSMVVKVFEGEAYPDYMERVGMCFEFVKGYKPKATRDVSREMFVIAKRFRPPDLRGR